MASSGDSDIVVLLLQDHEDVKHKLELIEKAERSRVWDMFWDLTNDLVRHEVAEEEIVYPEVRKSLPAGDRLADERIAEQSEAEQLLAEMEKAGADDPQLMVRLTKLRKDVLAHAEKEETEVFAPLQQAIDDERRAELGQRYEKAKSAAPTHPHPNAPDTPPGDMMLGPVAALVDRTRDAFHKLSR